MAAETGKSVWKICGLELKAGEKRQAILHPNGGRYEIPATLISGVQEGKTLLITAQIHAGEYNGTAAAVRLAKAVEPEKLSGNLLLMHCVNTSGFWRQKPRFIPEDHVDLNADYPGREDGTIGQQIAAWFVRDIFPQTDFIADLHGGGMCEALAPCLFFPRAPKVRDTVLEAAKAMHVAYLVASSNSAGEYGYAANCMDIPGFILEYGYGGLMREEWVRQIQECMEQLMAHLGMYPASVKKNCVQKIFEETEYLESDRAGVWYPAVREGQRIQKGQLLGELGDFFGTVTKRYFASADGTVLYYTAGMCVLEGDPLVAYGLDGNETGNRSIVHGGF